MLTSLTRRKDRAHSWVKEKYKSLSEALDIESLAKENPSIAIAKEGMSGEIHVLLMEKGTPI